MNIRLDVEVNCLDGLAGHCAAVVLDPVTRVISHIVVKPATHGHAQVLVPLDYVVHGSVQQIGLRCTLDELGQLGPFVPGEPSGQAAVPEGEVIVHAGTPVQATDGHAGQVDRFFIAADSGAITQLVLLEKHLLSKKDFVIPVDQIDRIGGDAVILKLSKHEIEQLPRV
jgi:sporulation protein YlmC with PRC-barrel domain